MTTKYQQQAQADVLTASQRSYCMSRIRSKDTSPELKLRLQLWKSGLRYRKNSDLPGKPDVVFPGRRLAVFVDGCFWHRCRLHSRLPRSNRQFWIKKLNGNVARDAKVNRRLAKLGWRALRVWEHEVEQDIEAAARKVVTALSDQAKNQRQVSGNSNLAF